MKRKPTFDERVVLMAKKYGLNVKWQQLKYGFKRAAFTCGSYEEMYAIESLFTRMKDVVCEQWCCSLGEFDGRVYVMDAADHEELENQCAAERMRVEDWWERYHDADEETRRLMACGVIA